MRLHNYFRSSTSFRVRIALELKGLDYEYVAVNLRSGEHRGAAYLERNPEGLVPTLELKGGRRLTQSLAIMEYLDEAHPEPALLPADAAGRARVRALALLIACEIHPLDNLRVLRYLSQELGADQAARNRWYCHWVRAGLESYEAHLARQPGRFSHGDAPGLADCCLVPQIFNAQRFDCSLDGLPNLMRVFEACMALPPFQRAQPSACPDAVA